MKNRLIVGLGLLFMSALGGAFVFSQEPAQQSTIALEKAVHFLSPDGADTILSPGEYSARLHDEKSIELTAVTSGETTIVQAETGTHEEKLSVPTPAAVASGEDVVHIVLLMPEGKTLDAIGTFSGVRTRGPMFVPLQPQQLAGAMAMQPRVGKMPVRGAVPGGGVVPGEGLLQGGGVVSGGKPAPGVPQQETQLPFQIQPGSELQKALMQKAEQQKLLTNPPLGNSCNVGPDGKLLPVDAFVRVSFAAKATDAFSVELTWTGPPVAYTISGGVDVSNAGGMPSSIEVPKLPGSENQPTVAPGQKLPLGQVTPPTQSPTTAYTYRHARPTHPVLPDFQYNYLLKATLPDGRLVCEGVSAKTLPATIVPLQSVFVSPSEIRLGFMRPPHAQEVNVYRKDYVEDGRQPPFNKRVFQEIQPGPSNVRPVNPGLPPLPQNYTQPIVYDFLVEAVWQDNFKRTSKAQLPIRVDGPLPLNGWADLHTHPMSNLAFGGKIFHGGPDVGSLLPAVDVPKTGFDLNPLPVCLPDHRAANMNEALGSDSPTHGDHGQSRCGNDLRKALILIMELMKGSNGQPGNRLGAPDFSAWPKWYDITHQKMWVEWIRRAHEGGLRVLVGLSHNNRLLGDAAGQNSTCQRAPITCVTSDKLSSDLQIKEMKDFVARNSGFMQVAGSPAELYSIVRSGKLAVVLGIEIDNIGDFNRLRDSNGRPRLPTQGEISQEIQRLYDQGVRYIFPIHVFDNVFGDTAPYESFFQAGNVFETGQLWKFGCAKAEDEINYHAPINIQFQKPISDFIKVPAALQAPICSPDFGHRNSRTPPNPPANPIGGLTPLGEFAIAEMMKKGMIIDIDHMSHQAVERALQIAESIPGGGYPLMSGHSAIRDRNSPHFHKESHRTQAQLDRIGCLGGMFGLGTDGAEPRIWAFHYQEALSIIGGKGARCLHKQLGLGGVAFGTDTNSLVATPKPLLDGADVADRTLNIYSRMSNGACPRFPCDPAPKIGLQVWNLRTDGVAHYGMFADFVKAVWAFPLDRNRKMLMSGQDLVDNRLSRNADNFWRMWVKVEAQKNNVR